MALSKLMKSYTDRMGLAPNEVRFLFDGERIADDATPEKMQMEQDDVIEVFKFMTGGGC
jgi:small ubiquitin-related modifier